MKDSKGFICKRLRFFVAGILFVLHLVLGVFVYADESSSGKKTYKVPVYEGSLAAGGKVSQDVSGLYANQLKDLSDYYGWEYKNIDSISILSSFYGLQSGELDFCYDIYYKQEWKDAGLKYSINPSGRVDFVILAREDDSRFSMLDLKALDGIKMGYEAGNPLLMSKLERFEDENDVHPEKTYFGTATQMLTLLQEGYIDVCVVSSLGNVWGTKNIYSLGTELLYFASFDFNLISDIDYYVTLRTLGEPFYFIDLLASNSTSTNGNGKNFSREEVSLLNELGGLTFLSTRTKEQSSSDNVREKYWNKMSEISGINFNVVDYEERAGLIERGELQIFESLASNGKKEGYMQNGDYFCLTKPFYEMSVRLIAGNGRKVSELSKGKDEGTFVFETTEEMIQVLPFFMDKYSSFEFENLRIVTSTEKCLSDLAHGNCDAIVISEFDLNKKYSLDDFSLSGNSSELFSIPISFAAECGSKETCILAASILEKIIQRIPDNYYGELLAFQGLEEKYSLPFSKKVLRYIFFIVLFVVVILVHSYVMMVLNSRNYKKIALYDSLTGVLSSAGFEKKVYSAVASKAENTVAVVEFNVRKFSALNKLHGTVVGDKTLMCLAKLLSLKFGAENVSRSYGDCFYVMKVSSDRREALIQEMYRFQQTLQEDISNIMQFRIVLKTGMVFCSDEILDANAEVKHLMSCADYARKTKGLSMIDNFCLFDESLKVRREEEADIDTAIENALKNEDFYVVYQPKIELKTEKIRGAEALVRWKPFEIRHMAPERLIEILEGNGYIEQLDFYVYRKTFEFMQELLDKGEPVVPISLNVSRLCFNALEFVEKFYDLFKEFNIPAEYVELEIEERFVSDNEDDHVREITETLKKIGFRVSMDDFGTGASSLNMLSEVPVDTVKFDRVFLRQAETSESSRIVLESLILMLKKMGKKVLCEGVETSEQISILKDMGCELVQGYYYSKPLNKDLFYAYLKEHY